MLAQNGSTAEGPGASSADAIARLSASAGREFEDEIDSRLPEALRNSDRHEDEAHVRKTRAFRTRVADVVAAMTSGPLPTLAAWVKSGARTSSRVHP